MTDLFKSIQLEGEVALQRLVDDRYLESITLDFKTKSTAGNGTFSKEDRIVFGKLLSGFANSAGGLGIWGIDARKGEDGVDCAQKLAPITDIKRFYSEAQNLAGQLLMPKHDGVEIEMVPSTINPDAGYLLVQVNRSDRRPHRCEATGEKHYFKRAGDSFFAMEHYDIEDAFRRGGSPVLKAVIDLQPGSTGRDANYIFKNIEGLISLHNTSDTLCRFPFLRIVCGQNTIASKRLITGIDSRTLPEVPQADGWVGYYGGSDHVIHPGQVLAVARACATHSAAYRCYNEGFSLSFTLQFGGLGVRQEELHFRKDGIEMKSFIEANFSQ